MERGNAKDRETPALFDLKRFNMPVETHKLSYKPIRLLTHQFGDKTLFQLYPFQDITTLHFLYDN